MKKIVFLLILLSSGIHAKPLLYLDNSKNQDDSLENSLYPKREFRAAWVTTLTNLDWPSKRGLSSVVQKNEFSNLMNKFSENKMNAIVVQVRPASDAFYESDLSPWSEWLTGIQGAPAIPYYDPMQYMLDECKNHNMEFHAWFNPLRAISHHRFSSIASNHITNQKPEWFFRYGDSYYFNPGIPEVRKHLVAIVLEVVKKYDIDGIHIDDYFYPYTIENQALPDAETFKKYGRGIKTIHDWRRDNINLFIKELSESIKKEKSYVKFGVSPYAVWRNKSKDPKGSESNSGQTSYDNLYSDTKLWVENGWLDYIAPQLYWNNKNTFQNYSKMIKWWTETCTGPLHLYIGLALYKLDENYVPYTLIEQVKIARTKNNIQGTIFYRAQTFNKNTKNFKEAFAQTIFSCPSLVPTMPWLDDSPPLKPNNLVVQYTGLFVNLKWKEPIAENVLDKTRYYVVYRIEGNIKNPELSAKNMLKITNSTQFTDTSFKKGKKYTYIVTSFDRLHNESIDYAMETISIKD